MDKRVQLPILLATAAVGLHLLWLLVPKKSEAASERQTPPPWEEDERETRQRGDKATKEE